MISSRSTNNLLVLLIVSIAVSILSSSYCNAFTLPTQNFALSHKTTRYDATTSSTSSLLRSSVSSDTNNTNKKKNVIVISPPGGIGEITSLNTAKLGGNVKWFVVRAPQSNFKGNTASRTTNNNDGQIALTTETLNIIQKAGGSIDFAGASADTLVTSLNEEDGLVLSNSALSGLASWLSSSSNDGNGSAGGASGEYSIICTYDGALDEKKRVQQYKSPEELEMNFDEEKLIKNGIRLAARQALSTIGRSSGSCEKIALLSTNEEELVSPQDSESGEEEKEGGLLGSFFGGKNKGNYIPSSLNDSLGGLSSIVRYGELFGAPESSPESSPFMGGPKRDPTVREMYTLRSVRLDPSGNMGDTSKSNRLAVGEIASQLGLGMVDSIANNKSNGMMMDVSLSSFAGTDTPTNEEWNAEFERVLSNMKKSGGAQLFSAEFSSVPSTKRLAEWIATKWAPAILRSYDIAGTRVGARPVYALQTGDDETTVEIVWQELVDFKSVTSGKMIINVNDDGITASRGAGNASDGYGRVSSSPLPGEEILIRRLADAASQAVEKGLAVKPQLSKKAEKKAAVKKEPVAAAVASAPPAQPATSSSDGPGPRSSGARRSSERSRGRRKSSPPSADGGEP